MTYSLSWTSEAFHDLSKAFAWYEEQVLFQLSRLEGEIRAAEQELQKNPHFFRPLHENARRVVLRIFPYRIWYVVNDLQQECWQLLAHTMTGQKLFFSEKAATW